MYFLGICQIFSDIIIVSEFGALLPIRPPPKAPEGEKLTMSASFFVPPRFGAHRKEEKFRVRVCGKPGYYFSVSSEI